VETQTAAEALVDDVAVLPASLEPAVAVEEAELYAVDEIAEPVLEAHPAPAAHTIEAPVEARAPEQTVLFHSGSVSWSQPTVEVPLEERAQASVESAQAAAAAEPVFEEVFDELHEAPTGELPVTGMLEAAAVAEAESTIPPVPVVAAAASVPEVPVVLEAPIEEAELHEESFADLAPAAPFATQAEASRPSNAAEIAVPVDMVSQIAQRVVGQISEKVIREIAWEVIPELAEALIRKEIERLKAELQET
jgi:hypothetical protein